MGLFDYFSKDAGNARRKERARKKLANMYYQTNERLASAQEMAAMARDGDTEAIAILLMRFEHLAPSSQIDRDEKEYVLTLLSDLGDAAVPTVIKYVRTTQHPVYWPLRFLIGHWPNERFVEFLSEILEETDNEYVRDPKKKIGILQLACDYDSPRLRVAMEPFVEDQNETVRFHAVDAIIRWDSDNAGEVLQSRLTSDEESGRITTRVVTTFADKKWVVTKELDDVRESLPPGFALTSKNTIERRG